MLCHGSKVFWKHVVDRLYCNSAQVGTGKYHVSMRVRQRQEYGMSCPSLSLSVPFLITLPTIGGTLEHFFPTVKSSSSPSLLVVLPIDDIVQDTCEDGTLMNLFHLTIGYQVLGGKQPAWRRCGTGSREGAWRGRDLRSKLLEYSAAVVDTPCSYNQQASLS